MVAIITKLLNICCIRDLELMEHFILGHRGQDNAAKA